MPVVFFFFFFVKKDLTSTWREVIQFLHSTALKQVVLNAMGAVGASSETQKAWVRKSSPRRRCGRLQG
jgi:hypothetical protein